MCKDEYYNNGYENEDYSDIEFTLDEELLDKTESKSKELEEIEEEEERLRLEEEELLLIQDEEETRRHLEELEMAADITDLEELLTLCYYMD